MISFCILKICSEPISCMIFKCCAEYGILLNEGKKVNATFIHKKSDKQDLKNFFINSTSNLLYNNCKFKFIVNNDQISSNQIDFFPGDICLNQFIYHT